MFSFYAAVCINEIYHDIESWIKMFLLFLLLSLLQIELCFNVAIINVYDG